ncbi:exonuclease domain-containing protein [Clavibacter michiganensis]|uniref:exonuclease domain-containing protein n=1 Tax=Clavibacter michiganensis TaxID=28447 RepID=UPI003DA188B3
MAHGGYAVIDFETTGLSPAHHHRIIEVGVVHVAPDGTMEDSFETVINPSRDLGPTHIHRLRGADVRDAPSFAAVSGRLVELLRGRVLVAHNARFETTFLRAEMARLGLRSPVDDDGALCTMKLAGTYLPGSGRKLADCCAAYDITLEDAHEALADARATAQLLSAYLDADQDDRRWWEQWGDFAARAPWPAPAHPAADWLARSRGGTAVSTPELLDRATDHAAPLAGSPAEIAYAGMLDQALADGYLSLDESDQLHELARSVGLGDRARRDLQTRYFSALVDAAWRDGVLSPSERRQISAVGTMLDIPSSAREEALRVPRMAEVRAEPRTRRIGAGDVVVLTGEMSQTREQLEQRVMATGAQVARAVTKKTTLLVAADPDSLSGKAQKARQYGIQIVDEPSLLVLMG